MQRDIGQSLEPLLGHVALFNDGVRSRDFAPMLDHFAEDAELVFEGVPVGPFRGRDAIAAAYRAQPPDDEILVSNARRVGDTIVTDYAWAKEPHVRAGEMHLRVAGETITRLVVTFDASVPENR